jgi:hypothetical protein
MKKSPFTPQGVSDFQKALYRLDDARLLTESLAVANDPITWIVCYFEIDVFMLERMRSLPAAHLRCLGWCLALSVLSRLPLQYDNHRDASDKDIFFSIALAFSTKQANVKGKPVAEGQLLLSARGNP